MTREETLGAAREQAFRTGHGQAAWTDPSSGITWTYYYEGPGLKTLCFYPPDKKGEENWITDKEQVITAVVYETGVSLVELNSDAEEVYPPFFSPGKSGCPRFQRRPAGRRQ